MRINEVWKKGHPTKKQVVRMLENFFRGSANVSELPKGHPRGDIEIEIYVHEFIDTFGMKGFSDRFLNLIMQEKKLEKFYDAKRMEELTRLSKRNTKLFFKVYKKAVKTFRELVPYGWISGQGFGLAGPYDIETNSKMKIYIKRDFSITSENKGTYYHVTRKENLSDISNKGLQLGSNTGTSFDGYRNRIYLLDEYPDPDFIASLMARSAVHGDFDTEVAILEVNVPDYIEVFNDPEYAGHGHFVEEPIPKENIKLDYKGLIKDNPRFNNENK